MIQTLAHHFHFLQAIFRLTLILLRRSRTHSQHRRPIQIEKDMIGRQYMRASRLYLPLHLPRLDLRHMMLNQANPIYRTNVPDIAMSFSDLPFAYGPFVPHRVPKQYLENYFSAHHLDKYLVTNTTVEDISKLNNAPNDAPRWSLALRRFNAVARKDEWWRETFDAVIIANGHYSVPYVRGRIGKN